LVAELGIHVCEATYRLEGDGPLVLIAYETVTETNTALKTHKRAQTVIVAQQLNLLGFAHHQLLHCAQAVAMQAYMQDICTTKLQPQLEAFKALQIITCKNMGQAS